jgi:hypothetical protein
VLTFINQVEMVFHLIRLAAVFIPTITRDIFIIMDMLPLVEMDNLVEELGPGQALSQHQPRFFKAQEAQL